MTQVFDWIAHHARYTPDKIAAIDLATSREFTYQQLDKRIGCLANFFQTKWKIQRGDRIAVLAMNSTEYFEIQFACARVGAIMVPLNWRLVVPELEYIVGDCSPKALIYEEAFAPQAGELKHKLEGARHLLQLGAKSDDGISYEIALESSHYLQEFENLNHDDIWMILYTSGTTGRPKGAIITHGMVFWNAVNIGMMVALTHESKHLNVLPAFHSGGLNLYANPCFHIGATVVVAREFNRDETLEVLANRQITHFFGVPAIYLLLSQNKNFEKTNLSGVRSWGCGGAPLPVSLLNRYSERGVIIQQGCGMTETSPTVFLIDEKNAVRKAGSVGKPAMHTSVRIVDENGNDVAQGSVGELWIKGPNVTPGYWNRPEAATDTFTDAWFHSGDAAQQDDEGFYYIVDRCKDMYISGGENVYPAEIEQVLYQLPQVLEAAVIGVPDEKWGEVGKALIVLQEKAKLTADQVISHCQAQLAKFKIPNSIEFVDELPKNATGKVLKHELRKRLSS